MFNLKVLCAYPYFKKGAEDYLMKIHSEIGGRLHLIVDSGAFTAHQSGKPIRIDDYMKFISNLKIKGAKYIALDVIGDHKATKENYKIMLESGFRPMPVLTAGQHKRDIEAYYETTDYICIGGLVGLKKNERLRYLDHYMRAAKGRKVHLLGYTSFSGLKHFKPFSADSSTWEGGPRFGKADIYVGNGKMERRGKKEFINPDERILQRIKAVGIDYRRAKEKSEWKGGESFLREIGAASWNKCSIDFERSLNVNVHLAFATEHALKIIYKTFKGINQ